MCFTAFVCVCVCVSVQVAKRGAAAPRSGITSLAYSTPEELSLLQSSVYNAPQKVGMGDGEGGAGWVGVEVHGDTVGITSLFAGSFYFCPLFCHTGQWLKAAPFFFLSLFIFIKGSPRGISLRSLHASPPRLLPVTTLGMHHC